MIVCGIDGSTTKTGIALFRDGAYQTHTLIDHHKNKDSEQRINLMMGDIVRFLQVNKPDAVWIERPAQRGRAVTNIETERKLSELLGAVRLWCVLQEKEYHEIYPSEWRKKLDGFEQGGKDRNALKLESMYYIAKHLSLDVSNDEADALCIALSACQK